MQDNGDRVGQELGVVLVYGLAPYRCLAKNLLPKRSRLSRLPRVRGGDSGSDILLCRASEKRDKKWLWCRCTGFLPTRA